MHTLVGTVSGRHSSLNRKWGTSTHARGLMLAVVVLLLVLGDTEVDGVRLTGDYGSFVQYPTWNGCNNASFSFEFRTTQKVTAKNITLWYVDDGGSTDFFSLMIVETRRVRLVLQLADTRDGNVEITLGNEVTDGQWHRVEVRRKRAVTYLVVDGETESQDIFGDHFHFGRLNASHDDISNVYIGGSHVYIGGIPPKYSISTGLITQLAMPSVVFMDRFRGSFRNIVYGNCTCRRVRAPIVGGRVDGSPDADDVCMERDRNPCREGCLCTSTDDGPTCDCTDLTCVGGSAHYELPMDAILSGNRIANPSGLDARATGSPPLVTGVRRNAIQVNGRENHIRVTGPAHRHECFGDLDKCSSGYTIALWANFSRVIGVRRSHVYLSNGGHTTDNHGVAMLYDGGTLSFRFRRPNGQEWTVESDNVLPWRWYHLLATWDATLGLSLYVNGDLVDTDVTPTVQAPTGLLASLGARGGRGTKRGPSSEYNEFILGKPNDGKPSAEKRPMRVDEFNFWSTYVNASDVRNIGPFYHYHASMDARTGNLITDSNLPEVVVETGNPEMVAGKIKQAVRLDGRRRDVINLGAHGLDCLGNLSLCVHGLTAAMWIRFDAIQDGAYFMDTGNDGISLYYREGKLVGTARQAQKSWAVTWPGAGPEVGEWYFMELSWDPDNGLKMYVDLELVGSDNRGAMREVDQSTSGGQLSTSNFYFSRYSGNMAGKEYGSATIDDLDIWFGERSKLIELDFITRGRPVKHNVAMDSITGNQRVAHAYLRVDTSSHPVIIGDGKIGGALYLNGNGQYASIVRQHNSCLGNLDVCRHGMLLAMWIKPGQLQNGMDLVSSGTNGVKARFVNGQLRVSAKTSTREWSIPINELKQDRWQFLEIGWSLNDGLQVFIDNQLVGHASIPTVRESTLAVVPEMEPFHVGRGDGTQSNSRYGVLTVDDLEYWYGNRDHLLAFDYIQRGRPQMYLFDMDNVTRIVSGDVTAETRGEPVGAPGKISGAIRLDGSNQYIDFGQHAKSCFNRLDRCRHGVTGSIWLNFRDLADKTYYFTSGGGLRIYRDGNRLVVTADLAGKRWETFVSDLNPDQWYFVEYTWHPEKGLELYIDNRLVASRRLPSDGPAQAINFEGNRVLIGTANPSEAGQFRYANGLVDEFETWFRDRDNLIAFEYIMRGNVTHIAFPFETQRGTVIAHPDKLVSAHNGATLVAGRVGNGVQLEGSGEYVSLGDQANECMGNLELCRHGLYMSFYVKPRQLLQDSYLLASGAYSVYTKDGRLFAKFSLPTKTWETSSDRLVVDRWHKVELTWDAERGLQMYINGVLVGSSTTATVTRPARVTDRVVYIGRPTNDNPRGRYADAIVDELDFWYAGRSTLMSLGLLDDEIRRIIIDMDEISNDLVVNEKYVIYAVNEPRTVTGLKSNAIYLDGRDQYIELPARDAKTAVCHGSLNNCLKGFTLRFKVKPEQLVDGTYLVSSPYLDVYQQNGRLNVEVRTPTTVWRTVAPSLPVGSWSQVEVAWSPADGLQLLVDGSVVQRQANGVANRERYAEGGSLYVGRSIKDMSRLHYAHATFDDVQLWEAKRDLLISNGLVDPAEDSSILPKPSPSTTPSPAARRTTTVKRPSTTRSPKTPGKWLHFDGSTWIYYDLNELEEEYRTPNRREEFHIRFQTDMPDSLLWYNGNETQSVYVIIKDGVAYLVVSQKVGADQVVDQYRFNTAGGVRLDDGKWHDMRVTKNARTIKLAVDGYELNKQVPRDIVLSGSNRVYLAGSNDTSNLTGRRIATNFVGTISEAGMNGENYPSEVDLLDLVLVKPRPHYVFVHGDDQTVVVEPDRPEPITFTGNDNLYFRLPVDSRVNSLELNFQTVEPSGLLLYADNPVTGDVIGVETFDGLLYVILDFGNGITKKYLLEAGDSTSGRVDDGRPHRVRINIGSGPIVRLRLDDTEERSERVVDAGDGTIDVNRELFVGGIDDPNRPAWHVWSRGNAARFYRGCVWGLKVNSAPSVRLAELIDARLKRVGVEVGCRAMPADCRSVDRTKMCLNDAVCRQFWNGQSCDCSTTAFTGLTCAEAANILALNGSGYVRVNLNATQVTHVNTVSARFKTLRPDGTLLITSNRRNNGYLKLSLENGRGVIESNINRQQQPVQLYFDCPESVSDGQWHTAQLKRRANVLEACISGCSCQTVEMSGDGYTLDLDEILIGGDVDQHVVGGAFVGMLQNVYVDDQRFLDYLTTDGRVSDRLPAGVSVVVGGGAQLSLEESRQVTFVSTFRGRQTQESFAALPTLQILGDTKISLMLRTSSGDGNDGSDGILVYNGGIASQDQQQPSSTTGKLFVAYLATSDGILVYNGGIASQNQQRPSSTDDHFVIELVDKGRLRVAADDGGGPKSVFSRSPSLADGQWHSVDLSQTGPRTFSVRVDDRYTDVLTLASSRNTLDLTGELYIGGVPALMRSKMPANVLSKSGGFSGCLASTVVNGRLYDLITEARQVSSSVTRGCTNTTQFCSPDICQHFGVCYEGIHMFRCDCNMTSFVGSTCQSEAEGYLFTSEGGSRDIVVFYPRPPQDTTDDSMTFGFMTWHKDGILLRADGQAGSGHFIQAALVNGHVVFTYNVGKGVQRVVEDRRLFNDGKYHYVRFTRTGDNAVLRVDDDLEMAGATSSGASASTTFNGMWIVKVGGNLDANSNIVDYFNGIIAGVYINGYRVLDMSIDGHRSATCRGDCKIAPHMFNLPPPSGGSSTSETDDAGEVGINIDDGCTSSECSGADVDSPEKAAVVGSSFTEADVGTRASAVAGTMLGILAAASSLVWALYTFKPGLIAGAGSSGAGDAKKEAFEMTMSASNSNDAASAPLLGASAPPPEVFETLLGASESDPNNAGANGHGPPMDEVFTPMNQSVDLADHFAPMTKSPAAALPSKTMRTTRSVQTDLNDDAFEEQLLGADMRSPSRVGVGQSWNHLASRSVAMSLSDNGEWANTGTQTGGLQYAYESNQMLNNAATLRMQEQQRLLLAAQQQQQLEQQRLLMVQQQQQQQLEQQRLFAAQQQQLEHQRLLAAQQQQQQLLFTGYQGSGTLLNQQQRLATSGTIGSVSGFAMMTPNLMAAEEIRVDCIHLSTNGRYVVTGSIYGPPQVWDLKTGNLVKVMAGENLSSTDLHLANGDTLLVGQVAELKKLDASEINSSATLQLRHRRLQIWDFDTGRPLEMRQHEICTASSMLNNGEHVVIARTDPASNTTTVVVWDVLGNEPIRYLSYDECLGQADSISYLKVSPDDRFVIAGVQSSLDSNAQFLVFDLKQPHQQPKVIAFNARAEVTVITDNDEAITGTRSGDLTVWNLRTGKSTRRLTGDGHLGEVTDLALSKDRMTLISASVDKTLKMWNLETGRSVQTFNGHTDEVWCCTLSNDNELIASGSRDRTIRLWRTSDATQVTAINAGVDVFRIVLSNNKQTVVALADKLGARKLIMLQIVRSKVKTTTSTSSMRDPSSRPTSPGVTPLAYNFVR